MMKSLHSLLLGRTQSFLFTGLKAPMSQRVALARLAREVLARGELPLGYWQLASCAARLDAAGALTLAEFEALAEAQMLVLDLNVPRSAPREEAAGPRRAPRYYWQEGGYA